MATTVKVRVPGTTANCGPGFDSVGIACTIYNDLELTLSETGSLNIEVTGEGSGMIPLDNRNVVVQAIQAVLAKVGQSYQGISIKMDNQVPLSRGLGSSAAAVVAGLTAANAATGNKLSKEEIFNMATAIEGHPDNVAPAIFGGITVSVMDAIDNAQSLRFCSPPGLTLVVTVPEFKLSTKSARQVLPSSVPFKDAVFNVSRAALLAGALCKGELQYLKYALADKLHQPYREKLIPGMCDVFKAAVASGALGAAMSGAGPCLIAFTEQNPDAVGQAMVQAFAAHEVKSRYLILDVDDTGARIIA